MSYISEKEADEHIFTIINLFKKSKYDDAINIIKEKNIDPQHSSNIISDYAALWLEEPHLIPFFKKIKKIGGNPIGHDSISKNLAQLGKSDTLKYLIEEGVLEKPEIKKYIVYIINTALMGGQLETFKVLNENLEIKKYKLSDEKNPSFVNVAVAYPNKEIFRYLFKNNLIQPYFFEKETIGKLEYSANSLKSTNENKEKKLEAINFFIKKVANHFELKGKNDYISKDGYEPGDIATIFKKIEYDALNKSLSTKKITVTKVKKI